MSVQLLSDCVYLEQILDSLKSKNNKVLDIDVLVSKVGMKLKELQDHALNEPNLDRLKKDVLKILKKLNKEFSTYEGKNVKVDELVVQIGLVA